MAAESARAPGRQPSGLGISDAAKRQEELILSRVAAPLPEPLLVRAPGAGAVCGIAARTWRRMAASGRVPAPVRIGGAVLWRVDELRGWCEAGCPARDVWERMREAHGERP